MYWTGELVFINLVDDATAPASADTKEVVKNVTQNVTSNVTETNTNASVPAQVPKSESVKEEINTISGSATSNIGDLLSTNIAYYIGGLIIVALIIVIFALSRGVKDPFKEFASSKHLERVRSLEILPRNGGSYVSQSELAHQQKARDAEIKDAERKLDEARRALDRLKR